MVYQFNGNYSFSKSVVEGWNSSSIGVYYCGYVGADGILCALYVGRAVGEGGIRGRLLQHLCEDKWPRVTHFGYKECSDVASALAHEAAEILRLQPTYNTQGK